MSGCLLDTNVVLLATVRSSSLPAKVRHAIRSGPNYVSVVSYWEVMLKSTKGNLKVGDPRAWWSDALDQMAATPLSLNAEHIGAIYALPPIHQDPFDRVLIAQAMIEDLALVSTDGQIGQYASERLRVIR